MRICEGMGPSWRVVLSNMEVYASMVDAEWVLRTQVHDMWIHDIMLKTYPIFCVKIVA